MWCLWSGFGYRLAESSELEERIVSGFLVGVWGLDEGNKEEIKDH